MKLKAIEEIHSITLPGVFMSFEKKDKNLFKFIWRIKIYPLPL